MGQLVGSSPHSKCQELQTKKLVEAAGSSQQVLHPSTGHSAFRWFPPLNLVALRGKFNLSPFHISAVKCCDHNLNSANGLQVMSLTPLSFNLPSTAWLARKVQGSAEDCAGLPGTGLHGTSKTSHSLAIGNMVVGFGGWIRILVRDF